MSKLNKVNNAVDKAQLEAKAIESQGIKTYLWNRPTKMSVAVFLITLATAFVLGAILF